MTDALLSAPVLARVDPAKPITVERDACDYGIAAILSQETKLISCVSRLLSPAERKYSITEKECLAVIFGIQKFRHFLEFEHFTVITDHQALTSLMSHRGPNPRLTRWAMALSGYDFDIAYRRGVHHANVDCLSRYPISPPPAEEPYEVPMYQLTLHYDEEDNSQLRREQQQDAYLKRICSDLENIDAVTSVHRKQQLKHFELRQGILYRKRERGGKP